MSFLLTAIDTAIEKIQALIAKYQQIKAGLMQDRLTGKVSLQVAQPEAAHA